MSRSSWDNATLWERIADALADGQERPATEIAERAGYLTVGRVRVGLRAMAAAGLVERRPPRPSAGQIGRPACLWRLA